MLYEDVKLGGLRPVNIHPSWGGAFLKLVTSNVVVFTLAENNTKQSKTTTLQL